MFYFASLKSQFSYTLNVKTDCFIWPFSDTGDSCCCANDAITQSDTLVIEAVRTLAPCKKEIHAALTKQA